MILYRRNQINQEVIVQNDKIYIRESETQWDATNVNSKKVKKPIWSQIFNEEKTKCSRYKTRKLEKEYRSLAEKNKPIS